MLTIFILKFITLRYTLLFSYFEIYIAHIIYCEWSRSVIFFRCVHAYLHQMVSERSSISYCITCFVSFGIRDYSFMLLEDYAFNFLHGCWNYVLIKTDIDVMMFKFEFKYVKLNFKAIASMKFSFDIILWLSRSYVSCSRKTVENCPRNFLKIRVSRVSVDRKSLSIDRVKQWSDFLNRLIFNC